MTRVTIREVEDGWQADDGTAHRTAADALRHVKADAQHRADTSGYDVMHLTWEPSSRVGRLVVRALTEAAA